MADYLGAFSYLLANEGSAYVDDPADRGGSTRYGITLATLTAWRLKQGKPTPTAADVRLLTASEASDIYRANYWAGVRGDELRDNGVACLMLDVAANNGVGRAIKLAQLCVNDWNAGQAAPGAPLAVDGALGAKTLAAVNSCDRRAFLRAAVLRQLDYYDDLVAADAAQRKFLKTWLKRAAVYRDLNW